MHEVVCAELDKIGESTNNPLGECLTVLVGKLKASNVISEVKVS